VKSQVYSVKSSTRDEKLLNSAMDAFAHIRNDKPFLKGSVTSLSQRAKILVDKQGGHFTQLINIIIINYFVNFHYYVTDIL
jgi:hypothetical protein